MQLKKEIQEQTEIVSRQQEQIIQITIERDELKKKTSSATIKKIIDTTDINQEEKLKEKDVRKPLGSYNTRSARNTSKSSSFGIFVDENV
jgi:hypothetical protein